MNVTNQNPSLPLANYFLLFILLLQSVICLGQKETFIENIFEKEFSMLQKEHSNLKKELPYSQQENIAVPIFTSPSLLPHWLLNLPLAEKNVFYAVGISDPWVDSQTGRTQALRRAQGIACLMNRLNTKGVQEFFNNEPATRYQQISQFIAAPQAITYCEPIDSLTTKYREQLYLYKVTFGEHTEKNHTAVEYFISSDNQNEKYNQFEKLRLKTNIENCVSEYECLEINRNQQIKSVLDEDTIQIIPATYRYSVKDSLANDPEVCLLVSGLWQGYLKALVHQLDISAADLSPKIKSLSDNLQTEASGSGLKHLIRTIYNLSFSFSIATTTIRNHILEMQLEVAKDQEGAFR